MENILHIGITVAVIAVVLFAIVFTIVKFIKLTPEERQKRIKSIIYALAVEAEKLYGSKTGAAKKKQVIAWFYEKYTWLSLIVSEDELSVIIDNVVYEMTEYFKSNPVAALNILGHKLPTDNAE